MKWFVSNWNELRPIPWNSVMLAIVAVLCGAIVGIEREATPGVSRRMSLGRAD